MPSRATAGRSAGEPAGRRRGRSDPVGSWRHAFLAAPYLRDTFVSLGVLSDTFETAITWDRFTEFHAAVMDSAGRAIAEACGTSPDGPGSPRLSCRFTHVYPDGPAPYYTVLCPAKRGGEVEQWDEIKAAVSETVIESGGHDHPPPRRRARPPPLVRPPAPGSVRRGASRRQGGRRPVAACSTRASSSTRRSTHAPARSPAGYALTFPGMETLTEERPAAPRSAEPRPPRRSTPVALLVAMRPSEWIKNLLVFAGLLFSQKLKQGPQVVDATITFAAFCAISSAGYLFNDLRDVAHDRQHPKKRRRPIASGELAPATAIAAAIVLAAARLGDGGARGVRRGRRAGGALRGDHRRILGRAQEPGDPRRDDDRLAVPASGGRGSRGRRGARLGVAAAVYRDAGAVPRLHQAPPGGDVAAAGGRRLRQPEARRKSGHPAGARALLAPVPRPDDRDGDRGRRSSATRSTRSTARSSAARCSRRRPRSCTGSSATCT